MDKWDEGIGFAEECRRSVRGIDGLRAEDLDRNQAARFVSWTEMHESE
jgi:hypothetical protein